MEALLNHQDQKNFLQMSLKGYLHFRFLYFAQKSKLKIADLEEQLAQVEKQRDDLEQQLQQSRAQSILEEKQQGVLQPHAGSCKGLNAFHDHAHADRCAQNPAALVKLPPAAKTAACISEPANPALTPSHAANLAALAAEIQRMLEAGSSEEACRFLMEVRCMQLGVGSTWQVAIQSYHNTVLIHARRSTFIY